MEDFPFATPAGQRIAPNAARMFFALWYLLGSLVHIRFALTNTRVYTQFGSSSLFTVSRDLWTSIVMPHITFFALLLAALEMPTGILILSRGRLVTLGLATSVSFNLFLLQLGLGWPAIPGTWSDFVHNRLPNLLFALLQLPLFRVRFDKSVPELLRIRKT
jgi:hypothetical protein